MWLSLTHDVLTLNRDGRLKTLDVSDSARAVAREVLWPVKFVPWIFKPLFATMGWVIRGVTIEFLPPEVQREFGLPSTKLSRFTHSLVYKTNQFLYPGVPAPLRHMLKNVYMADFRHRIKHGRKL